MITYKYCVYDEDHKIDDRCFDTFEEAYDYAQNGLVTFIEEVPIVDGVEQESEIVWSWDDTWDRDEAIDSVARRHGNEEAPIDEDIEIEIKSDEPEELISLAHAVLGDNVDFFDQEFEVPSAEVEIDPVPVVDEPEDEILGGEEDSERIDPDSEFADLYPELLKEPETKEISEPVTEPEEEAEKPEESESEEESEDKEKLEKEEKEESDEEEKEDDEIDESLKEGLNNEEFDRFMTACKKLGLKTLGEVDEFAKAHGNAHDLDLLSALEDEASSLNEGYGDEEEYVECVWCLSPTKKCDCVHDRDFGWICKDCLPQVEAQGNRLHLDTVDDLSDEEFVEAFGKALINKKQEKLEEDSELTEAGFADKAKRFFNNNFNKSKTLDDRFPEGYFIRKYRLAKAGENDDVEVVSTAEAKTYDEAVKVATAYSKQSDNGIAIILPKENNKVATNNVGEIEISVFKNGKKAQDNEKQVLKDKDAKADEASTDSTTAAPAETTDQAGSNTSNSSAGEAGNADQTNAGQEDTNAATNQVETAAPKTDADKVKEWRNVVLGESLLEANLFTKLIRWGENTWSKIVSGEKKLTIDDICSRYSIVVIPTGTMDKKVIPVADKTDYENALNLAKNAFNSGKNDYVALIGSPYSQLQKEADVGDYKFPKEIILVEYYTNSNGKKVRIEKAHALEYLKQFEGARKWARDSKGKDFSDLRQTNADDKQAKADAKAAKEQAAADEKTRIANLKAAKAKVKELEADLEKLNSELDAAYDKRDRNAINAKSDEVEAKKAEIETAKEEVAKYQKAK